MVNNRPDIPKIFLLSNPKYKAGNPKFRSGLIVKLKVSNTIAANDTPLLRINIGKSFHATVPTTLYLKTA
jgi:hypothetical protein